MENEPTQSHGQGPTNHTMTLLKAVELGEYDPKQLAQFAEWSSLSRHGQFELVKKGLANRDIQLRRTWAEINNQLNFSRKPHLHSALANVEKQIQTLRDEEDRLFVEFTM